MPILIFCTLSLKMLIHAPKIVFFWGGGFYSQNWEQYERDPKRHILGRKHVVRRIDRLNKSTCPRVRARREPKNKAKNLKKVHLRNHNTCCSRVCPDHPRCCSATWICMCGHTCDPIIYSKFHRNPFRGFGAPGVRIWPFHYSG